MGRHNIGPHRAFTATPAHRPYVEPSAVQRLITAHTPATTASDLPRRGENLPEHYFAPDHVTTLPEFAISHRAPLALAAKIGRIAAIILLAVAVMAPLGILFVAASNA